VEEVGVPNLQVFELAEVAAILGMPISKVKNWTSGRPLSIRPSIKVAKKKGSRNLYGVNEVFLLGFAKHLADDGISFEAIDEIVGALERDKRLPPTRYRYLILHRQPKGWTTGSARLMVFTPDESFEQAVAQFEGATSLYICDLKKLGDSILQSIHFAETLVLPVMPPPKSRKKRLEKSSQRSG
jgi:hypothetical protein